MVEQIETMHIILMICLYCINTFGFVFYTTYIKQEVRFFEYAMLAVLNFTLVLVVVVFYGPILVTTGICLIVFLLIYLCKKLTQYIMLNMRKSD